MLDINKLKNNFAEAELLIKDNRGVRYDFENWDLEEITSKDLSELSLRVRDNNKSGSSTATGSSSKVLDNLIAGAKKSVEFGEPAYFNFSDEKLNAADQNTESKFSEVKSNQLVEFAREIKNTFKEKKPDLTLNFSINKNYEKIKLLTTRGAELKENKTGFSFFFSVPIPGGGSELYRYYESDNLFEEIPEADIDEFIEEYELTEQISKPKTGKMPVLFSPRALYFFLVSLETGVSSQNIFQGTSPLIDKLGDPIFSDKLTVIDKPQIKGTSFGRMFDDEGITTSEKSIIENGKLNNYLYDLEYASKMDTISTGNGMKNTLFGSGIDTPVNPSFVHPVISPGNKSKAGLLAEVNEGILVENVIGFHSSNYTQGHFSVQAQGFHVKGGKLQGRLEDVMLAGNIYSDFKNIIGIGDRTILSPMVSSIGNFPYILVDQLSVTGE